MSNYYLDKKEREMSETNKTSTPSNESNEIFEYIRRNRNGKKCKVGLIVGRFVNNKIYVGWSKTNLKAKDKFDYTTGLNIACLRMPMSNNVYLGATEELIKTPAPADIKNQLRKFSARTVRYFKGATELHMPVDWSINDNRQKLY